MRTTKEIVTCDKCFSDISSREYSDVQRYSLTIEAQSMTIGYSTLHEMTGISKVINLCQNCFKKLDLPA